MQATAFPGTLGGTLPFESDDNYGRHERRPPKMDQRFVLDGPLHKAVGDPEALAALITSGEHPIDERGNRNFTPLICAARSGCIEAVRMLHAAGASLESTDLHGSTALHRAAYQGDKKMVYALVDLGADLEATDRYGRTALHVAADNGSMESAKALLKRGASTYAKDGPLLDGQTPLEVARAANEGCTADLLQAKEMRRIRLVGGDSMLVKSDYLHVPFR